MVLVELINDAGSFKGRRGVWFIDNVAALMALVRGSSRNPDLNRMAGQIHALRFTHRAWIYFEWVESNANWADGISRLFGSDPFAARHAFCTESMSFPRVILAEDLPAFWERTEILG